MVACVSHVLHIFHIFPQPGVACFLHVLYVFSHISAHFMCFCFCSVQHNCCMCVWFCVVKLHFPNLARRVFPALLFCIVQYVLHISYACFPHFGRPSKRCTGTVTFLSHYCRTLPGTVACLSHFFHIFPTCSAHFFPHFGTLPAGRPGLPGQAGQPGKAAARPAGAAGGGPAPGRPGRARPGQDGASKGAVGGPGLGTREDREAAQASLGRPGGPWPGPARGGARGPFGWLGVTGGLCACDPHGCLVRDVRPAFYRS